MTPSAEPTQADIRHTGTAQFIQRYCSCMHAWNASYENYAKSVGLSFTTLSMLSAIYETPNCTQKHLCERCFLPKQTVNAAVTALYRKGWVALHELPEDRRNKAIRFTAAGLAEAERILKKVRDSETAAMSGLSAEEQAQLLALTRRYVDACAAAMKKQ